MSTFVKNITVLAWLMFCMSFSNLLWLVHPGDYLLHFLGLLHTLSEFLSAQTIFNATFVNPMCLNLCEMVLQVREFAFSPHFVFQFLNRNAFFLLFLRPNM